MGQIDGALNVKLGELIDNQTDLLNRFTLGLNQVEEHKNEAINAVVGAKDNAILQIDEAKNLALAEIGADENLTVSIGAIGEMGFGVSPAPTELANEFYLTPLVGYDNPYSINYGNYEDLSGSIMVFIPAFAYKYTGGSSAIDEPYFGNKWEIADVVINNGVITAPEGFAIHRAFINAGEVKRGIFVDKYGMSNEDGVGVSKRRRNPVSSHTDHNPFSGLIAAPSVPANRYDGAYMAAKSRGAEYALCSIFVYNALAILASAHAQAATLETAAWMDIEPYSPKGNNNNALKDYYDASVAYQSAGYSQCGLTGGVPDGVFAKITHNGQRSGVADINGNMWEVAAGWMQIAAGAHYVLKESADIRALTGHDTALATDAYKTEFYDPITLPYSAIGAQSTFGNGTNAVFNGSIDRASADYKLDSIGFPRSYGGSPTRFGGDGWWYYNVANSALIAGGHWNDASRSGVWARHSYSTRSFSYAYTGLRAYLI
jgi:hypothetical protein